MKAETVLRLVSGALQDLERDAQARWSWEIEEENVGLLDFLNAAIRDVAMRRPDVMAVTEVIQLEPGMRQALPCPKRHGCRHKATLLIDVPRNMDCGGERPGRAIIGVNMNVLMAWACSMAESRIIENWAYDRTANPDWFMVYPAVPQNGDVFVEATFAVEPCEVKSAADETGLPYEYSQALYHHMLGSILIADSSISDASKGAYHMQMYNSLLGIKTGIDAGWPRAKSSAVPAVGSQYGA